MAASVRAVAATIVLLHMAFVAFVVLGGLLALRWPRVAWVHVPAALWGAVIALGSWVCPLTPFENWLRGQGGQIPYTTGFLEHYLLPILYPVAMTRDLQIATGVFVVGLNGLVYWRVLRKRKLAGTALAASRNDHGR